MAAPAKRKFPYPFKSMIAIASDIDSTKPEHFDSIHQYLNTESSTAMGTGIGLDIGDTFVFYNKADTWTNVQEYAYGGAGPIQEGAGYGGEITYWQGQSTTPKNNAAIIKYIKCGWIDSIHTYGNWNTSQPNAFVRSYAVDAINELNRLRSEEGINVTTWIDHGDSNNIQNFATQVSITSGAHYHLDLAAAYGFKYYWGPLRFLGGMEMVGVASMLTLITAANGAKFWRFDRNIGGGLYPGEDTWNYNKVWKMFHPTHMQRIVDNGLYEVFAQHWGYAYDTTLNPPVFDLDPFLGEASVAVMQALRARQDAYEILVARTARLLAYNVAQVYTQWTHDAGTGTLNITTLNDPQSGTHVPTLDEVRGLTWYVDDATRTRITLNGVLLNESDIVRGSVDASGRQSIGIRWWDYDRTDYTTTSTQDVSKTGSLQPTSLAAAEGYSGVVTSTLTISAPFTLDGTTITVIAPPNVRTSAEMQVYSANGGELRITGDDAARFALSADDVEWVATLTLTAGANTVYLSVVPLSGDGGLTATIGEWA